MDGLLIGSGFSMGFGMPLVDELTTEVRNWLTPEKIRSLNRNWTFQGLGFNINVIEEFAEKLEEQDVSYEEIIGWLQTRSIEERILERSRDFHGLYSWMLELIHHLLLYRHIKNLEYIQDSVKLNQGLRYAVKDDEPLWIFSLNHDLCVEIFASEMGIPIKTGIHSSILKFPRRNKKGKIIGELTFNVMNREDLVIDKLNFFKNEKRGINLLKIHGSLDVFLYLDEKKYVKLLPSKLSAQGWLESLEQLNNDLLSPQLGDIRVINEIAFEDYDGEIQFLRRTILAGEYKFNKRISQNTPPELLKIFEQSLNHIDKLTIIGYGFGDVHINKILENWINCSNNKIEIINPSIKTIPDCLNNYESCITIQNKTTIDYAIELHLKKIVERIAERTLSPAKNKDEGYLNILK